MINNTLIAIKKPGHLLAEGYLNNVLTKFPTAFGFGGREGGKLVGEPSKTAIPVSELNELQNVFRDAHLVMCFHNFAKANMDEDVQPFTIHREGEALLHVFLEGDFSKYEKDGHDGASNYFVDVMAPRLEQAMTDAGSDNDKFFAELRKPGVQKDLAKEAGTRSAFILLPLKGDIISFGDNKVLGGSFPWGDVTQTLNYADPVEEEVKPKASVLSFMRGKSRSEAPTPEPTPTPDPVQDPKPAEEPGRGPVADPTAPEVVDGKTKMFPPPKLHGKARNLWLRTFNGGKLPDNHDSNKTFIWVAADIVDLARMAVTDKKAVEGLQHEIHRRRKTETGTGDVKGENQPSAAAKAAATASAAREILTGKEEKPITRSSVREPANSKQTDNKYLPVMTDADTTAATGVMLSWMAVPMNKRPSPLDLQKQEAAWPTFSSALGIAFNELLFMPIEKLMELFDGNKKAVCAIVEFRRNYINASGVKLEDLVGTLKVDTKGDEPTVTQVDEPKKTNVLGFLRGKSRAA